MYQHTQPNHLQPTDFFGYFYVPEDGQPTAAVFVREQDKPGYARLYLCNPTKTNTSVERTIACAKADVSALRGITQHLCTRVTDSAPLIAALYHQGYDWPAAEKIEIEIPVELENSLAA